MPFKSDKQRRWMYANKPAMAARWAEKGREAKKDATLRALKGDKEWHAAKELKGEKDGTNKHKGS